MLDVSFIRENSRVIKQNIKNRGLVDNLDRFLEIDKQRSKIIIDIDEYRKQKNEFKKKPTKAEIKKLKENKAKEEDLVRKFDKIEEEYKKLLFSIPNITHPSAPVGKDENDNKVIKTVGKPRKFDFKPKNHVELGELLGIIDFNSGAVVSGAKFYYLKNEAVFLELALLRYGAEIAQKHGFELVITPDLAKTDIVNNMGYQPRGSEAQIYNIEGHDLSLVGTAEITLGGLHLNQIIDESNLPILYGGISHSFRTEAGSYGKHPKGLYRVHQFTKLELFVFCSVEESDKWHEKIVEIEEEIFDGLKIPYQKVDICTGDLGAVAYRKYDLEAWMPGRDGYGEITSASNCTDYQARNMGIRYRDKEGKTRYLHMLNGTGIAISRALIAILENNQQKDGSIEIPEVLHKYLGFKKIEGKL